MRPFFFNEAYRYCFISLKPISSSRMPLPSRGHVLHSRMPRRVMSVKAVIYQHGNAFSSLPLRFESIGNFFCSPPETKSNSFLHFFTASSFLSVFMPVIRLNVPVFSEDSQKVRDASSGSEHEFPRCDRHEADFADTKDVKTDW